MTLVCYTSFFEKFISEINETPLLNNIITIKLNSDMRVEKMEKAFSLAVKADTLLNWTHDKIAKLVDKLTRLRSLIDSGWFDEENQLQKYSDKQKRYLDFEHQLSNGMFSIDHQTIFHFNVNSFSMKYAAVLKQSKKKEKLLIKLYLCIYYNIIIHCIIVYYFQLLFSLLVQHQHLLLRSLLLSPFPL